jgi:hypothetical protein
VWHILDVAPNSPADIAGLLPYGDYVIGSPEVMVRGDSGLGELIEDVCIQFLSRSYLFKFIVHTFPTYEVTFRFHRRGSRGMGARKFNLIYSCDDKIRIALTRGIEHRPAIAPVGL